MTYPPGNDSHEKLQCVTPRGREGMIGPGPQPMQGTAIRAAFRQVCAWDRRGTGLQGRGDPSWTGRGRVASPGPRRSVPRVHGALPACSYPSQRGSSRGHQMSPHGVVPMPGRCCPSQGQHCTLNQEKRTSMCSCSGHQAKGWWVPALLVTPYPQSRTPRLPLHPQPLPGWDAAQTHPSGSAARWR